MTLFGVATLTLERGQNFLLNLAQYIVHVLLVRYIVNLYLYIFKNKGIQYKNILLCFNSIQRNTVHILLFIFCAALLIKWRDDWITEDLVVLFIADIVYRRTKREENTMVNYGVGMACSFFEGYLTHIIPSDGANFVGFEENIRIYEKRQGVTFPVKKLFIVVTKSLFCPPDLKHFNKSKETIASIEACQSLEDVMKDVAGVKNRTYRNSAYQIRRAGKRNVYLAAECATPLHTLYKALEKRSLYPDLANIDVDRIVNDFCYTLRAIIDRSMECRGKCVLVHYDDTNPDQNLADVLLDKIRELEPDFENIISVPR